MNNLAQFPVELVEKDLRDETTPEEVRIINSNKDLWRAHLVAIKSRVDESIIAKKSDSYARGLGNQAALNEFNNWKRGAVYFKNVVERKLAEVKMLCNQESKAAREQNQQLEGKTTKLLEEILSELKNISFHIERI